MDEGEKGQQMAVKVMPGSATDHTLIVWPHLSRDWPQSGICYSLDTLSGHEVTSQEQGFQPEPHLSHITMLWSQTGLKVIWNMDQSEVIAPRDLANWQHCTSLWQCTRTWVNLIYCFHNMGPIYIFHIIHINSFLLWQCWYITLTWLVINDWYEEHTRECYILHSHKLSIACQILPNAMVYVKW